MIHLSQPKQAIDILINKPTRAVSLVPFVRKKTTKTALIMMRERAEEGGAGNERNYLPLFRVHPEQEQSNRSLMLSESETPVD